MTQADRIVLDTNVIVAATVLEHPHHLTARAFVSLLPQQSICLTTQICREFLVVLTRSGVGERVVPPVEAHDALEAWRTRATVLFESPASHACCLSLVRERDVRGKPIHDANIVAVMRAHGVHRLATFNIEDFSRYLDLIQPVRPG